VLPWTMRNHAELGAWIPVSTNGGFTLLTGNNDSATGDYTPDDPTVAALMARRDLTEVTRDAEAKRLGQQWIAAHPGEFLALAPKKLARLWLPDGEADGPTRPARRPTLASNCCIARFVSPTRPTMHC